MIKNFFPNKTALYALLAACFVVCTTMGVRQTFGLYSSEFETTAGTSNTEFGLAIAVHAIFWGIFTPVFGRISDRLGGYVVIVPALIFYSIAMLLMGNNYVSGMWLQINLGLFVGLGLAGAAGTILTPMISKHFPNENRSKAAGYVTAFGGLGMFMFPAFSNFLITETGWQTTFTVFSIILLVMCIPGFFLKNPEKGGRYLLSSYSEGPFKINGVLSYSSFVERGDIVDLGFHRLEFKPQTEEILSSKERRM